MKVIEDLIKILAEIVGTIFKVFFDMVKMAIGMVGEYKPFQSRFVSASDILHRNPMGFVVDGRRGLSIEESFRHFMVIGPTGSGKTTLTIQPFLLRSSREKPKSYVVLDPADQLHRTTAGYLASIGYHVLRLNFRNVVASVRFNPLARAKSPGDIRVLSSQILRAAFGDQSHDAFWTVAAQDLLISLIMLLHDQPDPKLRHLGNVHELLVQMQADPDLFDGFVARYANEKTFTRIKSFYGSSERLRSSVLATTKAALSEFADDMAELVAFDDLDFRLFRERPTVLYIQAPVMEAGAFAVIIDVLLDQMLAEFMREIPSPGQLPVFFCLDELATIRFRSLGNVLSNARKHAVAIAATIQSEAMLEHVWSRAERTTIMANTITKLFLTGQDLAAARSLEETLGRRTVETEKGQRIEPLRTREDIRTLAPDRGIVLIGHKPPSLVKLVPFYKQPKLLKRSLIPPPAYQVEHDPVKELDLSETYEKAESNTDTVPSE